MRGLSNHEHPAAALLSTAESAVAGRRRGRGRAVKLQVQRRLVAAEIQELVRAYEAGATIMELRDRLEISRTTVIAHLRRAGVVTRYNRLEGRRDEAKRLYEQGWSLARVAAHFDVSAGTVQKRVQPGRSGDASGWDQSVVTETLTFVRTDAATRNLGKRRFRRALAAYGRSGRHGRCRRAYPCAAAERCRPFRGRDQL